MIIVGIDPGPTTSGLVKVSQIQGEPPRVIRADAEIPPGDVVEVIRRTAGGAFPVGYLVVSEWLTSYGASVGASVLDTARMVGRFEQTADAYGAAFGLLTRPDVCLELCQSRRAKKSEVRAALLEIYRSAGEGGGKTPQIGTAKAPGPLYGVKGHAWDALAVAIAWLRREGA